MRNLAVMLAAMALGLNASTALAHEHEDGHQAVPPAMVDGAFCHIEIPTTDMAATVDFYNSLFDWTSEPMMEGYHGFSTPDGVGGAFSAMAHVSNEGGPVLYIYCADIDSMLPRIEAAGGSVVIGRTPIPGTGWFSWFKDCCGNVLGLFSAVDAPEGDLYADAGAES